MSNSNLEFRKLKSLNFLYEISADGRIFRNVKSKKQNKIKLDFHHAKSGYYVTFVHINGRRPGSKTIRIMIHRAVAEAWLGPCPEGLQVDHVDRNTLNNHYSNLRYVTHSEQMKNRVLGEKVSKPVLVDNVHFSSMTKASHFIGELHNVPGERVRTRMKRRSKTIFGHVIEYLNAETRCTDSTE